MTRKEGEANGLRLSLTSAGGVNVALRSSLKKERGVNSVLRQAVFPQADGPLVSIVIIQPE